MTRKSADNRPKSGVLAVIAMLMIGSAAIRVGFEAGPALAKSAEPEPAEPAGRQPQLPGAQELLTELLRREDALKKREAAVVDREKALEIADQAIETRLVALQEAEESLRQTLAFAEKAAETDLTRLTDVYQSMKPKDAAALFETMDPGFAAGFLSRMPPDAAAGVLAGLSPEAAYTISVIMAGRNAAAPQE
ncbi:hypothetical protein [Ruegeria sp. R14_0]|uniref:MotE family protein n=1 Tax=Ruegeria sp. R14_0 TaxID=2821100 RepID=UPI001ADC16BD|nr:hypothetical protein [Ruegeria sp. R14_0]MBO9445846.1 hypothetical protein [Ruegeria sp. R14_0]